VTGLIKHIVVFCVCSLTVAAQPELRVESTGLPPAAGAIQQVANKIVHRSNQGLHGLDQVTATWRFVGIEPRLMKGTTWTDQPNGTTLVQTQNGMVEIDSGNGTLVRISIRR
jgi:hypothetical protein